MSEPTRVYKLIKKDNSNGYYGYVRNLYFEDSDVYPPIEDTPLFAFKSLDDCLRFAGYFLYSDGINKSTAFGNTFIAECEYNPDKDLFKSQLFMMEINSFGELIAPHNSFSYNLDHNVSKLKDCWKKIIDFELNVFTPKFRGFNFDQTFFSFRRYYYVSNDIIEFIESSFNSKNDFLIMNCPKGTVLLNHLRVLSVKSIYDIEKELNG